PRGGRDMGADHARRLGHRDGVDIQFNVVGAVDLLNAFYQGQMDERIGFGAAFYIPTLIVPPLPGTHGLIFWLLLPPQIDRMRPTSRQRMQRSANELAAEGLDKIYRQSEAPALEACAADAQRRCTLPRARRQAHGDRLGHQRPSQRSGYT